MTENTTYNEIPTGWKRMPLATSHPRGMFWINNGKSMFSPEYRQALCRETTK